jgi:hypothetical protein
MINRDFGPEYLASSGQLRFAVSDTISPQLIGTFFDSAVCSPIVGSVEKKRLALEEGRYLCLGFQYSSTLAPFWNDKDRLLVEFGIPFHNLIAAQICMRYPTDPIHDRIETIPRMSVKSDWRPRGRPRDQESSSIGLTFCFDEHGHIGNVHIDTIYR